MVLSSTKMARGAIGRRGLKSRSGFTSRFNGQRVQRQRRRTALARRQRGFQRTSGFFGRFSTGMELKFFDLDLDDAAVSSTGTVTDSINKIAQGTTEVTRIGRKCTIRSINWRFQVRLLAAANLTGGDVVRVILFLDKQCNGAAAGVTDILENSDFQSFNNLANKSRFRTLMDRTYTLNAQAGGGDGTANDANIEIITDSFFKKVNLPIEFDSTAGAITEIRSNNLGVLMISRGGTLSDFESKIRLRFSDG